MYRNVLAVTARSLFSAAAAAAAAAAALLSTHCLQDARMKPSLPEPVHMKEDTYHFVVLALTERPYIVRAARCASWQLGDAFTKWRAAPRSRARPAPELKPRKSIGSLWHSSFPRKTARGRVPFAVCPELCPWVYVGSTYIFVKTTLDRINLITHVLPVVGKA